MLIVGENLKALIEQHSIVGNARSFDESSITLTLSRNIITIEPGSADPDSVTYGSDIPKSWVKEKQIPDAGIIIRQKEVMLACSSEKVNMPIGYFGLIQTKGSLARLFVMVQCCDGQVDPGFSGHVTFEMVNFAPFPVKLRPKSEVAQLFIFKTSTKQIKPYAGRYQNSEKPTIHKSNS